MSGRAPVSVVIAARNAAALIGDCVASVGWVDQVLVVENDSVDDTLGAARRAGAEAFSHPFVTIGRQRNAAIERARNEWILVVDADERCTPELAAEVRDILERGPGHAAYRIGRRNFFLGREIRHGGWERDRPVRFFRRTLRYDERPVHEHVMTRGRAGMLRARLVHRPYGSLDEYFEKLDRYSRWWAEQNHARGQRGSALAVVTRPPARFVAMYVLRGGFLDGARGALVASLAAMSVAAKYARLWELTRDAERAASAEGREPGVDRHPGPR
jgi:glycosyltransferase involved in cell wall biosynthesis